MCVELASQLPSAGRTAPSQSKLSGRNARQLQCTRALLDSPHKQTVQSLLSQASSQKANRKTNKRTNKHMRACSRHAGAYLKEQKRHAVCVELASQLPSAGPLHRVKASCTHIAHTQESIYINANSTVRHVQRQVSSGVSG